MTTSGVHVRHPCLSKTFVRTPPNSRFIDDKRWAETSRPRRRTASLSVMMHLCLLRNHICHQRSGTHGSTRMCSRHLDLLLVCEHMEDSDVDMVDRTGLSGQVPPCAGAPDHVIDLCFHEPLPGNIRKTVEALLKARPAADLECRTHPRNRTHTAQPYKIAPTTQALGEDFVSSFS